MKKEEVLMTEGNVWKHILLFSIPLLIGNLFQQLYNAVDSIIVGNYVGTEALAAVSSSNSLINLFVGLFMGIGIGAGVLIAQYYGAKEYSRLSRAVHTTMALSFIGGLILTVVGFFAAEPLLAWMGTPDNVMPNSIIYFKIFFLGSVFNLVYNMGSGILRAVGDSKSPLYYLCISSVINIVLDILFVRIIPMGVAGAGVATILSQGVSAFLTLRKLMHSTQVYRFEWKKLKMDAQMAKRIISYGVPSGLQNSIISFSNVIVQTNINRFGDAAMAGCGTYSKIDGFALLPVMSFSMAIMTFVGQNIGAGKQERVKKGIFVTGVICSIYILCASVGLLFFGEKMIRIFSDNKDVVASGALMVQVLAPFYLFIAWAYVYSGALRGAGKSMASMLIMVGNLCGIRMLWVNIAPHFEPTLKTVLWGYPISWMTAVICFIIYAKKHFLLTNNLK